MDYLVLAASVMREMGNALWAETSILTYLRATGRVRGGDLSLFSETAAALQAGTTRFDLGWCIRQAVYTGQTPVCAP
jgi:hypothetical protein